MRLHRVCRLLGFSSADVHDGSVAILPAHHPILENEYNFGVHDALTLTVAPPLLSVLKDWVTLSNASPQATKEKSLILKILTALFNSFGVSLPVTKTRKRSGNQRMHMISGMELERTDIHGLVETSLVKQEDVLVPFNDHIMAEEVESPELLVTSTSYLIPFHQESSRGVPVRYILRVSIWMGWRNFYATRSAI